MTSPPPGAQEAPEPRWVLMLYVSGASANSVAALETVGKLCDEDLGGQVELQVVEVHDQPALVIQDRILAVPTLVKRLPEPLRQLVGNLADQGRVQAGLALRLTADARSPESG